MTSEEDFQAELDRCPSNHTLRLIFADWLEERDDPRAEGYRALGVLQVYPHGTDPDSDRILCYHNGHGTYDHEIPISGCHKLPQDWLDKTQDEEYARLKDLVGYTTKDTVLTSCVAPSRKWLEDCAATAFAKLPKKRRREILGGVLT